MKKFLSVFLVAAMLLCFAGCRSLVADPDDNTTDGTISDMHDNGDIISGDEDITDNGDILNGDGGTNGTGNDFNTGHDNSAGSNSDSTSNNRTGNDSGISTNG